MSIIAVASRAAEGSGDLIVGLLIGVCIGFLIGPAVRSWLTVQEWVEASRQARLADRILARMEVDAELDRSDDCRDDEDAHEPGRSWRTLR